MDSNKELLFQELKCRCLSCRRCMIGGQRIGGSLGNVFSSMCIDAKITVVGQNPGVQEVIEGIPFVGPSGKFFDVAMEKVLGIRRCDMYVTNTVKCLCHNSKVLLGDGTKKNIAHLVREKYSGKVVSVNIETGEMELKRVIGWYKSPLAGRKVYKVTYQGAKKNNKGNVGPVITEDHLVLTKDGFKEVRMLKRDDIVAIGEPAPNNVLLDIIIGSLLGDGSIARGNYCFTESHCKKQEDYLLFKCRCLQDFGVKHSSFECIVEGKKHLGVRLRTKSLRVFNRLYEMFYPNGVKNPCCVKKISDVSLAIWYMDDGNIQQFDKRKPAMVFSTNGFEKKEVDFLCKVLTKSFGIRDARVIFSNGWRIRIGEMGSNKLFGVIAKYINPSMRYKLPECFRNVEYEDLSKRCGVVNHWETGIEIEERRIKDTSMYCIDVEDNHNFVTTGGVVVHNCFTRGNRKPSQGEIENCRGFLDEEINLLKPRVIVTLGGPALQQVTGMVGIMKHHGKKIASPRYSVHVVPLIHPSPLNTNNPEKREIFLRDLECLKEFLE